MTGRDDALAIYQAAVAGALPGPATVFALRGLVAGDDAPLDERKADGDLWVVAVGKAAPVMAVSAGTVLASVGRTIAGGLEVSTLPLGSGVPGIEPGSGDHPVPRASSRMAAERLTAVCARVRADDIVFVLLSGGTSSLIGAPVDGVTDDDYRLLCERLLGSGLDIVAMNAVRKRFSRWGAGRLAAALAPARVVCLALSDVPGDDLAAIGSGPCVPDLLTAAEVRRIASEATIALPPSCDAYLARVERGELAETPKPGDPLLALASARVIAGADSAVEAAVRKASALGYRILRHRESIGGDAAAAGRALAGELLASASHAPVCLAWHGETTVRLPVDAPPGGRCQELALAAAEVLHDAPFPVTLLAAGTDGRDGTTDAAGAVVDHATWDAIARAGIDPAAALARHDAHRALDAVGALVRKGPTGTNVGDVVVGMAGNREQGTGNRA
ncbi:MAG TPA: DUF4147 domain-containing protein [Gemmatimonadaceae bacterium]|nr:DUF4147 domain-containing protein [Gemmatimonadaceae bacterium]